MAHTEGAPGGEVAFARIGMKPAAFAVRASALCALVGCASPATVPGGPEDTTAPVLVRVTPDSGATSVRPRDVVFQFNEVVSETPRNAPDLSRLVMVSPTQGRIDVTWRRNSIAVRPRAGWRDNTTYVVTLLPGLADLMRNTRDTASVVVFSTGDSIPNTEVRGAVFDWVKYVPAGNSLIQARPASDSTLVYMVEADSSGRFALRYLTPGAYNLRAFVDANRNRTLDPRELLDTLHVEVRDTATVEFYAFVHDTINGPGISGTTLADSLTVHLTFDQPLSPDPGYQPAITLLDADSASVPIARIVSWSVHQAERTEQERLARDSAADADTSMERRQARDRARRDSINKAAVIADSIARDTTHRVRPPVPARPPLVTEFALILREPLRPGRYRVRATARGVLNIERTTTRTFERAPPAETGRGGRVP
jgi:hypothetical protein